MSNFSEISLEALNFVTGGEDDGGGGGGGGGYPVNIPGGVPLQNDGRGPSNFNCTNIPNSNNMSCTPTSGDASGQSYTMPQSWGSMPASKMFQK